MGFLYVAQKGKAISQLLEFGRNLKLSSRKEKNFNKSWTRMNSVWLYKYASKVIFRHPSKHCPVFPGAAWWGTRSTVAQEEHDGAGGPQEKNQEPSLDATV